MAVDRFGPEDVRRGRSERFLKKLEDRERLEKEHPGLLERKATRREFLKMSGRAVAGLGVVGFGGWPVIKGYNVLERLFDRPETIDDQHDYDEMVRQTKAYLKSRYNVDLVIGRDKDLSHIEGDKVTLEKYKVTLRAVMEEMDKYPPEMIHRIGEGRGFQIRVMHDVKVPDEDNPLLKKERVGGVAPYLRDGKPAQVVMDSEEPASYQRQTVHHEINHRCAEKWQKPEERDQKWIGFHKGVSSYPYRRKARESGRSGIQSARLERYFLTDHAARRLVEDQAVCAEHMLTPRLHLAFMEKIRAENDPQIKKILAAKYQAVKAEYLQWSGGKMDDAYWDKIIKQGLRERAGVA